MPCLFRLRLLATRCCQYGAMSTLTPYPTQNPSLACEAYPIAF